MRAPDGTHSSISKYRFEREEPAPHLHRVSSDGQWLATLDHLDERFVLRELDPEGWARSPQSLFIRFPATVRMQYKSFERALRYSHIPREFRWLNDGSGFALQGAREVWLAPWIRGNDEVEVVGLFRAAGLRPGWIKDVRPLRGGLLVQASAHGGGTPRRLYFVRLSTDLSPRVHDITPVDGQLIGATVLSRGRIALAVGSLPSSSKDPAQLRMFSTSDAGPPVQVHTRPCATHRCAVTNWTPGSDRLVYALGDGRVMIEQPPGPEGRRQDVEVSLPEPASFPSGWAAENPLVHTLWTDAPGQRVLGATVKHLTVWDRFGREQWSWSPPDGASIYAAHFEHGTERVVVTTEAGVMAVDEEMASTLVLTDDLPELVRPHTSSLRGPRSRHFVDALPLPGGGLALSHLDRFDSKRGHIRRSSSRARAHQAQQAR